MDLELFCKFLSSLTLNSSILSLRRTFANPIPSSLGLGFFEQIILIQVGSGPATLVIVVMTLKYPVMFKSILASLN